MLKNAIINLLKVPDYREIDPDSLEAAGLQAEVFQKKKPLRHFYTQMYQHMVSLRNQYLINVTGDEIEIGSGGGFFKEIHPHVITTDIKPVPGIDRVMDACQMPFADHSLAVIYASLSLHHIPQIRKFLNEARRVLKPNGGIIATEPYWGLMGQIFFKYFCLEQYDAHAEWENPSSGPMSGPNQALSYILLKRDRKIFENEFPDLRIEYQSPFGSLEYLLAGALSGPQFLPTPMFKIVHFIEKVLPIIPLTSVFHAFVIKKSHKI